jgi:hypothetical protein
MANLQTDWVTLSDPTDDVWVFGSALAKRTGARRQSFTANR